MRCTYPMIGILTISRTPNHLCPTPTTSGSANCFGQRGCATAPIDGAIAPASCRYDYSPSNKPVSGDEPLPGTQRHLVGRTPIGYCGIAGVSSSASAARLCGDRCGRVHVVMEPGNNGDGNIRIPDAMVLAAAAEPDRENAAEAGARAAGAVAYNCPQRNFLDNGRSARYG